MAERCAYFVSPGKAHWQHRGGKYSVCVTPTQHRELFGDVPAKPPTPLGCGVFACAYARDLETVVKVTRDQSDVAAMQQAQGIAYVPKLYSAFRLASPTRWKSAERIPARDPHAYYLDPPPKRRPAEPVAYGMVLERVWPLDASEKRKWNKRLWCVKNGIRDARKAVACCPKAKRERLRCMRDVVQLTHAYEELLQNGIELRDLHGGNVGHDTRGRLKILDLGLATGTDEPEVEWLEGAGVRREPETAKSRWMRKLCRAKQGKFRIERRSANLRKLVCEVPRPRRRRRRKPRR
jgi:hypothetical protein